MHIYCVIEQFNVLQMHQIHRKARQTLRDHTITIGVLVKGTRGTLLVPVIPLQILYMHSTLVGWVDKSCRLESFSFHSALKAADHS